MSNRNMDWAIRTLASVILIATVWITPALAAYSLVWSDEFNGTTLDGGNWAPDIGNGCPSLCGWGNNELQYYRSENVSVSDGNLVLEARDEYYGGSSFTSGKVTTRGKRSFLYGRFEMRAKIPTGGGMWPAFWMMPQDDVYGVWASSGEIDIMEAANATTSVGGTIHYGGSWPDNTYAGGSYSLGGENFADEFHIYSVEWEAEQIRWYVDGVLFYTRSSAQWYSAGAPGNPLAPFDQDFYIILNAAVGGEYTGCTSPGCISADFPQRFLIDYVRVYEDIENFLPTVEITAPNSGSTQPVGDITITATASDSDGSIARVEFYNGSILLGEDTTAPYAHTWSAVGDGCYTIIARAVDDLGGTASDAVDIDVGLGCGQLAYLGAPYDLPTRIEAEDFDIGGEGVAYHDLDSGNNGNQYRTDEGVDIEICTDSGGGYNVGWLNADEWLEYTVDVPAPGDYTIEVRVASLSDGGSFRIEFDGVDKSGAISVPVTTGWQTWTTVTAGVSLNAGIQTLRFAPTTGGFNLNYIEVLGGPTSEVPELKTAAFELHPCYPNPFNPATTIRYDLKDPGVVSLTIHDLSGRQVRTLVASESIDSGRHDVIWNGRDEMGRISAAGIYFYRLDVDGRTQTRRMALVK